MTGKATYFDRMSQIRRSIAFLRRITVSMTNYLKIAILFALGSAALADAPALNGDVAQGGLVWGQVDAGTSVTLDGEPVTVHESGVFVIGFGRDAHSATLVFRRANGATEKLPLVVAQREFNIERVDGLPPKTVTPPPEWRERRKVETGRVRTARSFTTSDLLWLDGFDKPAQGRFSGFYGSQRILNGQPRSPHYGLDIAGPTGTPIAAPAGGVVRLAAPDFLLEGGIVIIDHGMSVTSTLFHMNSVAVQEGQVLEKGDLIGTIGATGRANGPHVDWRVNWGNVRLDPMLLIEEE